MNRGWYHHSMAHELASKGIKTRFVVNDIYSNGIRRTEIVNFENLPKFLYHATSTKNVIDILTNGLRLGSEEKRTKETDWEWEEHRNVEGATFFTGNKNTARFFGMQSISSDAEKEEKKLDKKDIDYTILRINTKEFKKYNFITFLGAELFNPEEREYFVKYQVPRFWIDGGTRIYYDDKKKEIVEEEYNIKWNKSNFELIPTKGGSI